MGKKVLIYEGMPGHGECLSSYYAYFRELGYDVDLVLRDNVAKEKPLWMIKEPVTIYPIITASSANPEFMKYHLDEIRRNVPGIFNYDIYFIGTFNHDGYLFVKFLHENGIGKNKILHQNHVNYTTFLSQTRSDTTLGLNGFTLGMANNDKLLQLPASINRTGKNHSLLDVDFSDKGQLNIFFSGLSHIHFMNFELFVKAVDELNKEGKNIKVNVCGIREQGKHIMPKSNNVKYLGRISFEDMTNEFSLNDFLFVLFDEKALKCVDEHKMFLDGRISGSRNMSIMYKIPLVVQKPYQKAWGFNDDNSISFEGRDYKKVLSDLYNMKKEDYNNIVEALQNKEKEEFELGLKNLKSRIKGLSTNKYTDIITPVSYINPTKRRTDFIHFKPRKGPWI